MTLLLCVVVGAKANYSKSSVDGTVTVTWDFGEFTENIATSPYDYNGLNCVMTPTSSDYINKNGFHANGSSSSSNRYMTYKPETDGTMTVYYKSNNSSATDRVVALATKVTTGASLTVGTDGVVGFGLSNGSTVMNFSAGVTANTTYYIYNASGGCTITKIVYTYSDSRTEASLAFATTSGSSDINDGTSFVLPTLTVTPNVEAITSNIKYASSNTAVATINASTGEVTMLKKGTTTITATFDGDETYTSAKATFTLTVEDRNAFDPANYNIVKTYDFTAMPNTTLTLSSSAEGKIWNAAQNTVTNNNVFRCTNEGLESIAVQAAYDSNKKGWKIENGSGKGLLEGSGAGRCAAICDIKAGWIVEFYHTSGDSFSTRNNQAGDENTDDGIKKTTLVEESGHHVFLAEEDGMIGFELTRGKYVNKIIIYTSESPKTISFTAGDADGYAPANIEAYTGVMVKLPVNQYLMKAGYTLTAWNDGTNSFAPGSEIDAPDTDITFTPEFTANTQSLASSSEDKTVTWNFRKSEVSINLQGKIGYYVQQAKINGETIDVPMKMDTSAGKMNNQSRTDQWIQSNGGTVLTIPAVSGMTIVINSYNEFGRADDGKGNALTKTKIAGSEDYALSNSNKTATMTYSGSDATIDIEVGGDISYMSTIVVTYPAAFVDVTIASSGLSTLASAKALDFSAVDGLKAYVVSSVTKDAVSLKEVTEIPANTGVILEGTAGTKYSVPVADGTPAAPAVNKLAAAVAATAVEANAAYILKDGEFHLVTTASTVPAGKAYLPATEVPAGARSLSIVAADETTGIEALESAENAVMSVYNLQGQRVQRLQKGLNIVNGKKVIVK